jgi:hypothetical protein
MMRRITLVVLLLSFAVGAAWAADAGKKEAAAANQMSAADPLKAMKDEMLKCAVCKNMATHIDEWGPAMTMDYASLNDGVAMIHGVSDPSKLANFRVDCAATHKAGEACLTMTDEQAKTQLCSFCQEIRGAMKAGAKMSQGPTASGEIMVLTSSDPAVKAKLDGIAKQCEMMAKAKM